MKQNILSGQTDDDIFTSNKPKFTNCFITTIPVLVPTTWLVITFIPYVFGLSHISSSSLPFRTKSVFKTGICIILALLGLFDLFANDRYGYRCESGKSIPTSFILAFVFNITNNIYVAILTQISRRKGIVASWMLWIFWIFTMVCRILPLQDNILYQPSCLSSIISYITFGLTCIQVILYSLGESPSVYGYERIGKVGIIMMLNLRNKGCTLSVCQLAMRSRSDEEGLVLLFRILHDALTIVFGTNTPVCPKPASSVISKLFFWWFTPVVRTCYKRTINKEDLWDQHPELQAEKVTNDLYSLWTEEERLTSRYQRQNGTYRGEFARNGTIPGEETSLLQRSVSHDEEDDTSTKKPSLTNCCIRLYTLEWFRGVAMKLLCDTNVMIQPLILKLIVSETEKPSQDRILWYGISLAVLIYLAGQLDAMFYIHASQMMVTLGLKVKTALIGVIYRKTLKVSSSVRKDYTVGEVVNLVSVDCQRIQDAFTYSNEISSFFFVLPIGVYELWDVMGISTLGVIAVILILTFFNILFGKLQEAYLMKILLYKGKRCRLLNEIIVGMKVIKMYAWEPYFAKKIKAVRQKEMGVLRQIARVTSCSILCAAHSPWMMNFALLLIYTLASSSGLFNAEKAFLALAVVNIIRFPLTMIPYVITGLIQAIVSLNRIQKFLLTDDVNPHNVRYINSADYAVSIHKGSFTWEKNTEKPTLGGINVNIPEGRLVAVVGHVGAGKTSFISSILGELEKLEGEVKINGSVAYVSQEAWIQNMTVKDNILYGHTYNERKYEKVLEACCLQTDLKILSAGDMTEIGERGINLSGGQKQRVNLARAVYSNCDIYLFDDPLSAVDSHVGKNLFKRVVGPEGMLRHKTRILVTHGVHWLPKVDEIIVLDSGRISERGTFEELVQHNGPFAQFLQIYLMQEDNEEEENDPEIVKIKDEIWDQIESVTSDGGLTSEDNLLIPGEISRRQSVRKFSRQTSIAKLERSLSAVMVKANMAKRESRAIQESQVSQISRQTSVKTDENRKLAAGIEGQLVQEEEAMEGSVKLSVIIEFAKAMGLSMAIVSFVCLVAQQGFNLWSNFWITFWTEDAYLKNATLVDTETYTDTKNYYLGIYALLGLAQGVTLFTFAIIAFNRFVQATGKLHDKSLDCIFRSPMSFFDTTPVGRIMNRFSSDIDVIDDRFPRTFRILSFMTFVLIGTIIVIAVSLPLSIVVIIPLIILYIVALKLYLPSARQLKRIESVTRSPVFNHFSETISGASIIRSYRSVDRFIDEAHKRLDLNSAYYYAANTGMGWIAVIIESLGNLILLAVGLFGIISAEISGADVGLALTYAFQIIIAMNVVVRGVSEMQMNIVSIERVEEYMDLPPEADWIQRKRPEIGWPQRGTIQFDNYKTRYRPGLELVLHGISCFIRSGERIGIVGRTGAGKSSLTQALFRLIEPAEGHIAIDDLVITTIGLHDLRRKITILPQDPVLFSDTLRVNLDPLGKFSITEIWKALECAHLKQFAMNQSGQLMSELGEGGNNLSVGQRQLVCLARTLLHKTNILILDEATAAVDMETDDLIQQTITEQFSECTILSIAHRLKTVMDYDRIMVMDKGMIAEFDSPDTLLKNKDGVFFSMAKDAGII